MNSSVEALKLCGSSKIKTKECDALVEGFGLDLELYLVRISCKFQVSSIAYRHLKSSSFSFSFGYHWLAWFRSSPFPLYAMASLLIKRSRFGVYLGPLFLFGTVHYFSYSHLFCSCWCQHSQTPTSFPSFRLSTRTDSIFFCSSSKTTTFLFWYSYLNYN